MPKQHNALFGNDLHQPKGIGVETTAEYLVISQSLNIISGSSTSSASFGHVLATTFKGDGSSLTGVTAEWDGTHSGNGTITGNFTVSGNISGSSTSTGSFGKVLGDGSSLTGITSFAGAAGTETLFSGSAASTGSFGKVLGDGSSLTGISGFDYTSGSSPVITTNPSSIGSTWINTTSGEIFVATDITTDTNVWFGTDGSSVVITYSYFGDRGIFSAGTSSNVLQYISISNPGNATDFGDLTRTGGYLGACSNGTKGVWGGGTNPIPSVIEYVTIATTGNATDFGDLSVTRYYVSACSDGTKGLFGGGYIPGAGGGATTVIDYITIATTGNASDFGDLTVARSEPGACSDGTKGVFGGGNNSNVIDYVTIASTGHATDFGDLTVARNPAACSDGTKGVWGGGIMSSHPRAWNVIDYITIATTGNATDFGNLTDLRGTLGSCSDGTKGVWGGGYRDGSTKNIIDYITIATTGNASDFGDLLSGAYNNAACSG